MAQSSRIFDDLGRLMNDAAGVADGVRREVETVVQVAGRALRRWTWTWSSARTYDALRELVQAQSAELKALQGGSRGAQGTASRRRNVRIAVISDVHGNRLALEAVLDDIARHGVDATFNLGDLVSGPLEPNWVADILMDLDIPSVRGNHDRELIDNAAGQLEPGRPLRAASRWSRGIAAGSTRCRRRWRCSTTCSSATARRLATTTPGSTAGGTGGP